MRRWFWPAMTLVVVALGLLAAAVAWDSGVAWHQPAAPVDTPRSLAMTSMELLAVHLAGATGVLGVGAALSLLRPHEPGGLVLALVGLLSLAPDVAGWPDVPPALGMLAVAATPLLLPALLCFVTWVVMPVRRAARLALVLGLVVAGLGAVLVAVRDPFHDVTCWPYCGTNPFLLVPQPALARRLDMAVQAGEVIGGLGIVLAVVLWGRTAGPGGRRTLGPVLSAAALVAVLRLAITGYTIVHPTSPPHVPQLRWLAWAFALAVLALAVAGAAWVAGVALRRRAVSRLATEVVSVPAPAQLEAELGRRLGDAQLRLLYPQPGGGLVDVHGAEVLPDVDPRRRHTELKEGDRVTALLVHERGLDHLDLERALGPVIRLALENGRLQALRLAQLYELRASRGRLVAAADAERRQLERDLHDRVQHRLLAVLHELRAAGDDPAARTAAEHTTTALAQLRHLAHGLYPAVLDSGGLEPALEELADQFPLTLRLELGHDCDKEVALAAYVVIQEVATSLAETGADLTVRSGDGALRIHATHEGRLPELTYAKDRVAALDGRWLQTVGALEVELPCG